MESRRSQIDILLRYAEEIQWPLICAQYEEAVQLRSIPEYMPVVIKNFCENLRSVLDYVSKEIREKFGQTADPRQKFNFPLCESEREFESLVAKQYPELESGRPALWRYLKAVQPFPGSNERWLRKFNNLNNDNKHFALVLQVHNAVPVDAPGNQGLGAVVFHDEERGEWVEFRYGGDLDVNARVLLEQALVGVRDIAFEVLTHLGW